MEVITLVEAAIKTAQSVRLIIAALKGTSNVLLSSRQLMHVCKLYESCLTSFINSLRTRHFVNEGKISEELRHSLLQIGTQVELDSKLLKDIEKETKEVADQQRMGKILSIVAAAVTGRMARLKALEAELMTRVQTITTLMMKDVWKAANGMDDAFLQSISDLDGSLFWFTHFGSNQQVSFGRFSEAYQVYLCSAFICRRIPRAQLQLLLRHTLLEEGQLDDTKLQLVEVSVQSFALWLKRFGPMKETFPKCSCISIPFENRCVPWFYKSKSRDEAVAIVKNNLSKYADGIRPDQLVVVRYSSDPKLFAVTVKLPRTDKIEHFQVLNDAMGYALVDKNQSSNSRYPTLLDYIQFQVMDALIVPVMTRAVVLPRDSILQWDGVFANVTAVLSEDHYGNEESLQAATNAALAASRSSSSEGCLPIVVMSYDSLFAKDAVTYSSESLKASSTSLSVDRLRTFPANEANEIVGSYMVRHGLEILRIAGKISKVQEDEIITSLSLG